MEAMITFFAVTVIGVLLLGFSAWAVMKIQDAYMFRNENTRTGHTPNRHIRTSSHVYDWRVDGL